MAQAESIEFACPIPRSTESFWTFVASGFEFSRQEDKDEPNQKLVQTYDPTLKIFFNNKHGLKFANVFAVVDSGNKNRCFIGFTTYGRSCHMNVFGLLVYFDELQGQVKDTHVFETKVADYDSRNGALDSRSSALYNQTLLFGFKHRDTGTLFFTVVYLNFMDEIIGKSDTVVTQIPLAFFDGLDHSPKYGRFYYMQSASRDQSVRGPKHVFLDLASLRPNNKEEFVIDKYEFPASDCRFHNERDHDDLLRLIETELQTKPKQQFGDGYPELCIKCATKTWCVTWWCGNSAQALGSGYCHGCKMRYSTSSKRWLCCQPRDSQSVYGYGLCGAFLDDANGFTCSQTHDGQWEQTLKLESQSARFPFRSHGTLLQTQTQSVVEPRKKCKKKRKQ